MKSGSESAEVPPPPPRLRSTDLPETEIEEPVNPPIPVVTEDTDLANLSAHEIYELNQEMMVDSVPLRPLIDVVSPMSVLREEYQNGSASFVAQIDWLTNKGYDFIRRARGDGDCFYRSLAFAYIERIMQSHDPSRAIARSLFTLDATLPMLDEAGFQRMVFEDFYECFRDVIQNVITPNNNGSLLSPELLLQYIQEPQLSNSIIVYLRLLTSAQIRTHPDEYTPYLANPDLPGFGDLMPPREFCERFVEATGVEADHVQIMALCTALKIRVRIAYLDGRRADGVVDFVDIPEGLDDGKEPLTLLYRPGHYDILGRGGKDMAMVEG